MAKWFPGRRLSWFRLSVLMIICAAVVLGGIWTVDRVQDQAAAGERTPWLAGYADVTATPTFPFEQITRTGNNGGNASQASDGGNAVLSFIVADPADPCEPSWGAAYSLDEAKVVLDLDRRIARLRDLGGSIMVSFGGQANSDLALGCTDGTQLLKGYRDVVDRYQLGAIDMDIEGDLLRSSSAIARQAKAIAKLQDGTKGGLAVWLTLPVSPSGLTEEGAAAVRAYIDAGVELAGVNAMTMNYASDTGKSMRARIESSLRGLHSQLLAIYRESKLSLGDATAWSMIGATPMIGQNDVRSEVFTLADAKALTRFADDVGISRVSYWSANRDRECDSNWPNPAQVSDSCSGVLQGDVTFAETLGASRSGSILQPTIDVEPLSKDNDLPDDPKTSPYPIWNAEAAYPAATKVVWRRNVYEAKWWTQDEQPDTLSFESTASPWRLIGPVLKGETPIERPMLPAGTYPEWNATETYLRGQRVMQGVEAYEAKWWAQGQSPDASLILPQDSPWRVLTDAEVRAVLGKK